MAVPPSASSSFTVRVEIKSKPGMLGRVASAIGEAGGDIGAVDLVETSRTLVVRDITIKARDSDHGQQNDEMKIAAAHAIAGCVRRAELGPEYIIPSVFNKRVAPEVARAVARAAHRTGVARRRRRLDLAAF